MSKNIRYNFKKIRNKIYKEVKRASFAPSNKFTSTAWYFHILPVVEHSLKLGKKLKADLEVLELAALLHDYAGISDFDFYEEHHAHSARMAEGLLKKEGCPKEKIEKIKLCILNHRGSIKSKRASLEEKIIASADAMSHITELPDMFYLAFGVRKMKTVPGVKWLKAKFARSWKKTMPEGKVMVAKEWAEANKLFDKVLK